MRKTLKRWLERTADLFRELDYSEAHRQAYDNYIAARKQVEQAEAAERTAIRPRAALDLFVGGVHTAMVMGVRRYVVHVYDINDTEDTRMFSIFGDDEQHVYARAHQLVSALNGDRRMNGVREEG